jgi:hypothetical protein
VSDPVTPPCRCPWCGREFELGDLEGKDTFNCPTKQCHYHWPNYTLTKDDLIGEWDNCAWDY